MDWKGNSNSIYKTLGASNHTDKEREKDDYYATDPIAIDKLLTVETPYKTIWECACGEGHLSEQLKKYGYKVISTDLINRGYKDLRETRDFLLTTKEQIKDWGELDILTNAPYKYAKEFVLKSLELVDLGKKVYMFLKLTFLEGKGRYKDLFSKFPPKNVYVFSERVLCAKNALFDEMKAGGGSAVAYAWYVWEKGYQGKTVVDWI